MKIARQWTRLTRQLCARRRQDGRKIYLNLIHLSRGRGGGGGDGGGAPPEGEAEVEGEGEVKGQG